MHRKTAKILNSLATTDGLGRRLKQKLLRDSDRNLLPLKQAEILSITRCAQLRGAYSGELAIALTCGPSLSEVCDDAFFNFAGDKLLLTVKQAHDLRPELSDYHLYNSVRMKRYDYPGPTIRISVERYFQNTDEYPCHLNFPIKRETIVDHDVRKALMATNNYDDWMLDREYERPWGIGIMFEIGLFMPIHFGCRKLLVIGFDMNRTGKYHFYRDDDTDSRLYARDEEFEYAHSSIPHYLAFAREHGLEVMQYSPRSELPIPKLDSLRAVVEWATGD